MHRLNIVVVGTGMYVCGRGTDGYGAVMPALLEWGKKNSVGDIYIAGTAAHSINVIRSKLIELKIDMNIEVSIKYFPKGARYNPESYKEAICKIPKPACAIVVVPDDLHREVTGYAIERGLHAFVVKPLVPTLKEARELITLQKLNKVYCAVEFHKRFDHANLKLKDTISRGSIGEPLYFLAEYSQRKDMPAKIFKKWVEKTNVFQYLGIHYVDIIYFVTKAIPKRAMAIGQKGWLFSKRINAYDSIQGVVEWELPSGKRFTSHILTNWVDSEKSSAMSDQRIKVIGTKGRFESDQKKRGIALVTDDMGIEEPNPYFCSPYGKRGDICYQGYGIESIQQFLNDVVQIEGGKLKIEDLEEMRPTFKQSIVPTAVLEAINQSLKDNGKWVLIRTI